MNSEFEDGFSALNTSLTKATQSMQALGNAASTIDFSPRHDYIYLEGLETILRDGEWKQNRTGIPTKGVFGMWMSFDLEEAFPLMTSKKVHFPSIAWELFWFLRGDTNIKYLNDHKVRIWDEWADPDGNLGPVYGAQWRSWPICYPVDPEVEVGDRTYYETCVDQLQVIVDTLRKNPNDRRMIVSAWNVGDIDKMKLPPCHLLFQFYVREGQFLDCQLYQRSCDMFLGVPFNIASYSLLVHIIARIVGLKPGRFIWVGGDCHIYENHVGVVEEQLARVPPPSPTLRLADDAPMSLDADWDLNHILLENYNPLAKLAGTVAV